MTDQPWASPHRLVDAFQDKPATEESTGTYARIVADSCYLGGSRLTTFEIRLHRFVLAELNTHRVFSRNSASSRAIPLAKQLAKVRENPALPVSWPSEKPGMQGGEELSPEDIKIAKSHWLNARDECASVAEWVGRLPLHKSVANRLLEPFMWHTVVITSTAYDNFFAQRANPNAMPEIRVAAEMALEVYRHHVPRDLDEGEWHLPYVGLDESFDGTWQTAVKVSSARSARTSYLTQNGVRDWSEDVKLYDRLVTATPLHASPLEHPATPDRGNRHMVDIARSDKAPFYVELPRYGNLLGWRQHRFDVEADLGYNSFS